ncbi:ABC transporter permease [Austwickia chelonae]|uniref:ABC transporter permease n=1 Tax=Austwickia chelonae TaxID=100225 RepID=UPI000E278A00|nr:ABC transporter permease [Austwickia chelonae]
MNSLRQFSAYLKRIYLEQVSYKTALALTLITAAISLLQFVFMGNFIKEGNSFPGISAYGGDILSYFVTGSIFTGFVGICVSSFSSYLSLEQRGGTLESVFASPMPLIKTMLFSAAAGLIGTISGSALMIFIFGFIFKISFNINILGLLIILFSLTLTLFGFGLAGCGVLLVTKKGDPITWVFTTATALLSGVMFPVSILPQWMQYISHLIPTTVALDGIRLAMLSSASPDRLISIIFQLFLWSFISVPAGIFVFRRGLALSRKHGSLSDY